MAKRCCDETLIEAARGQDPDAVTALIEHCGDKIAAALVGAGLRPTDASYEDAQNQALFAIWQQLPGFRGQASPCTWMYQIARRTALSRTIEPELRARRRQLRDRATTVAVDLVDSCREEQLADRDLLDRVMAELPDEDREILTLRVVLELSTKETAEHLFLSEGGVKTRLLRAKKRALTIARQLEVER